jgi:hypothetical protein
MGGVARIAANLLARGLGARKVREVPPDAYFDLRSIRIRSGRILPIERPRSPLFGWKNPGSGPDLVIFLGEEQPSNDGYRFCNELLDVATELGIERVVTFAAMATPIRPDAEPRVLAAATRPELVQELREHGVEVLGDAEITGLNGVLLAAAAERGLGGTCLLGEFPFFASGLANPKSSAAVLRAFGALSGVHVDLSRLEQSAKEVERVLVDQLRSLERGLQEVLSGESAPPLKSPKKPATLEVWPAEKGLDPDVEARIETLFAQAANDRAKALELKAELDRHGVFGDYENRFLDLFRQAE